jgi:hypothetical protein
MSVWHVLVHRETFTHFSPNSYRDWLMIRYFSEYCYKVYEIEISDLIIDLLRENLKRIECNLAFGPPCISQEWFMDLGWNLKFSFNSHVPNYCKYICQIGQIDTSLFIMAYIECSLKSIWEMRRGLEDNLEINLHYFNFLTPTRQNVWFLSNRMLESWISFLAFEGEQIYDQ